MLEVGDQIPDFTLKTVDGEPFTNEELDGKRVLLCFYPFAFSGVCTHQLSDYQERIADFKDQGIAVYACSVDAHFSQKTFQEHLGAWDITFLADFHPKGAVAQAFGIYRDDGFDDRALFLIGADGKVQWSMKMDAPTDAPSAEEVLGEIGALAPAGA